MNRTWKDPVKNVPPKESTLNVPGDFERFTDLMKKVVNISPSQAKVSVSKETPSEEGES